MPGLMLDTCCFESPQQNMSAPQEVGCRVQIVQHRATVRYIGNVQGQEGIWVGVEWDDPTRGKHDGSTGGIRYFTTQTGPAAGSFVRIEKVNFGVSVAEGLKARYTNQQGELGDASQEEMYVHTVRQRRVQIEVVGVEKIQAQQSQTHKLTSARLVGACISHVGGIQDLQEAGPNIRELDLTSNLVSSWISFVPPLTLALANLQVLNLSDNRVTLPSAELVASGSVPALPNLRALVLNDCGVTWHQVLVLEPLLPNLQELHLCGNSIHSLAPLAASAPSSDSSPSDQEASSGAAEGASTPDTLQLVKGFASLQVLSLEDNQIQEWQEVCRVARLPTLKKMHLSNNPLNEVVYPATSSTAAAATSAAASTGPATVTEGGSRAEAAAASLAPCAAAAPPSTGTGTSTSGQPFPQLEALFIGGCQVSRWSSVDQLDLFPALRELRVTGNPVLALSKSGGRFEIIGRVGGLASLNGADVKQRERRDSELRYLQVVMGEVEQAGSEPEARAAALVTAQRVHPRLPALLQRYGQVMGSASRADQGTSLGAAMVELKLTCVAVSASAKMGTQVKKLPRSVTLGALRILCEKLFRVKATHQSLFIRTPGDPLAEDITSDDESRRLGFYGVQDGYEVLVDEFDPQARARKDAEQRAAEEEAHEARVAGQLKTVGLMQAEFAKTMGLGADSAADAAAGAML